MMTTTMLSALLLRTEALGRELDRLAVSRGLRDQSRTVAARQVGGLVDAVARQAAAECERAVDDEDVLVRLRPLLGYLTTLTDYADLLFARDRPPPVSLVRAVQRELDKLGTSGKSTVRPLITVGGPGNFETDPVALWQTLYRPEVLPGLDPPPEQVHVFSVPAIEGSRALWTPIAVGHEVAHIAERTRDLVDDMDVDSWLDAAEVEAWQQEDDDHTGSASARVTTAELTEVLRSWAREVLCDLYAVSSFGPAAIAAQCDFLASVSADQAITLGSHPPPRGARGAHARGALGDRGDVSRAHRSLAPMEPLRPAGTRQSRRPASGRHVAGPRV
ncbi:hypothetical protein L2K70_11235 [Nocardioides KLBMP 9356]|uniref:Uncharacterized protein n=1 Tax=Nocardioides potassii TaxID=2911371 RepID=A0ABS9HAG6_9ACTN|nr:hypothetical protein [Nocardioides potassii]MCF6378176.1 hypothetical protein [Nocardioides potassii]